MRYGHQCMQIERARFRDAYPQHCPFVPLPNFLAELSGEDMTTPWCNSVLSHWWASAQVELVFPIWS